jgi:hypothetical protein
MLLINRRLILSLGAALALGIPLGARAVEQAPGGSGAAGAGKFQSAPGVAAASAASATTPPAPAPEPLSILKGRPDIEESDLLGGEYASPAEGISLHTPGASVQVKARDNEVAHFTDARRGWDLVIARISPAQPVALSSGKDLHELQAEKLRAHSQKKSGDLTAAGAPSKPPGLLEIIAAQMKNANPGAEFLRQDVVNLGEYQAGLIAVRFSMGAQRRLVQQAIIQANDQLYYTLNFTTPGAKASGPDVNDPAERTAVNAFRQVLDSVKLLDRAPIKEDQNERLFRTRALFVNLTPQRLKAAMIPEQWLRLMRDGKDIGYTYVVEEPDTQAGRDGIKIGIRSRSIPDADIQVDGETWYFVSLDRDHETWSNLAWIQNKKTRVDDQITEFGISDRRTRSVYDPKLPIGDATDKNQPPVRNEISYVLTVKTVSRAGKSDPVIRNLPVFYIPEAISHMLPRLLPLNEPKTYLFAVYVSDKREVMTRYVDVGNEEEVNFNGARIRAVPISDKLGLEGAPTIHYMSPEGKYLGSENKASKALILPSDGETLQKIWSNRADLTRPKMQQQEQTSADAPAPPRESASPARKSGSPPVMKVTPRTRDDR